MTTPSSSNSTSAPDTPTPSSANAAVKIVVLGATGNVGSAVVDEALNKRGWRVVAVVRDKSKMRTTSHAQLQVVEARNIFDVDVLSAHASDATAIVSLVAARPGLSARGPTSMTSVFYDAAATLVNAQPPTARLVLCTAALIEADDPGESWMMRNVYKPMAFHWIVSDMVTAEQMLRDAAAARSVIVRFGRIVDFDTGKPRTSLHYRPSGGYDLNKLHAATFVLDQIHSDEFVGKTVTVTE